MWFLLFGFVGAAMASGRCAETSSHPHLSSAEASLGYPRVAACLRFMHAEITALGSYMHPDTDGWDGSARARGGRWAHPGTVAAGGWSECFASRRRCNTAPKWCSW